MKNLTTLFALFIPFLLTAQTNIVWKGGTPGQETKWTEPQNWDANRVPGEFDHVVIHAENTGHFSQPVLDGTAQIASVEIGPGAELHIAETGQLVVDGTHTYSEGISIYGGKLVADGIVILKHAVLDRLVETEPVVLKKRVLYQSTSYDNAVSVVTSH